MHRDREFDWHGLALSFTVNNGRTDGCSFIATECNQQKKAAPKYIPQLAIEDVDAGKQARVEIQEKNLFEGLGATVLLCVTSYLYTNWRTEDEYQRASDKKVTVKPWTALASVVAMSVNDDRYLSADTEDTRDRGIRVKEKFGSMDVEFIYPTERLSERLLGLAKEVLYHVMMMHWLSLFITTLLVFSLIATLFWAVLIPLRGTVDLCEICPYPQLDELWFWSYGRMVGIDGRFDSESAGAQAAALVEGFVSMLVGALLTGVFYARLALPVQPFVFTDKAVICIRDDKPVLMFRIANRRTHADTDKVEVMVSAMTTQRNAEGREFTTMVTLPLVKSTQAKLRSFPFTVQSIIEEDHPLYGVYTQADLARRKIRLTINVSGSDLVQQSEVFSDQLYEPKDVKVGMHFHDQFTDTNDPITGQLLGRTVDFRYFNVLVPDPNWPHDKCDAYDEEELHMHIEVDVQKNTT